MLKHYKNLARHSSEWERESRVNFFIAFFTGKSNFSHRYARVGESENSQTTEEVRSRPPFVWFDLVLGCAGRFADLIYGKSHQTRGALSRSDMMATKEDHRQLLLLLTHAFCWGIPSPLACVHRLACWYSSHVCIARRTFNVESGRERSNDKWVQVHGWCECV